MTNINDYRARRDAARAYHPSVRPIWTPTDSVDTAQAFAAELDNAERGRPWLSKSRYRRAGVMDAIAVALLLALMACLGVIVFAASAKADPDAEAQAYADRYGSVVCSVLEDHPSVNGLMGIMQAIVEDGLTEYQAGEVVGIAIAQRCPEFTPIARAFVKRYGDAAA